MEVSRNQRASWNLALTARDIRIGRELEAPLTSAVGKLYYLRPHTEETTFSKNPPSNFVQRSSESGQVRRTRWVAVAGPGLTSLISTCAGAAAAAAALQPTAGPVPCQSTWQPAGPTPSCLQNHAAPTCRVLRMCFGWFLERQKDDRQNTCSVKAVAGVGVGCRDFGLQ